ncbi:MAG: hypothetical protein WA547_06510, partial [Thermoplasmata archaeon]
GGCPDYGPTDFGEWSAFASANPGIPQQCQGTAYQAMLFGNNLVTHTANVTLQGVLYAMISQIGRALGLYVWQYETAGYWAVAPWMNLSSFSTQLTSSGAGLDDLFYLDTGNGLVPSA